MLSTNRKVPVVEGEGLLNDTDGGSLASRKALEDGGVRLTHWQRLRKDSEYARRCAQFMVRGGNTESIDEKLARRIMGDDFFGSNAWADLHQVALSGRQMRTIGKFPWSEEILDSECLLNPGKAVSQTHFAFLGIPTFSGKPLTIAEWQAIHPADGQPRFYRYSPDCWHEKESFALSPTLGLQWYLGLKEAVPNSASKRWENMLPMLPPEYEVASPIAEVTKVLLYHKRNGVYLNQNVYAACDTLVSVGLRVLVGLCRGDAVGVGGWNGNPYDSVGLSAFRKSGI